MPSINNIHGAFFAVVAYMIWGIVPIFFKAMSHMDSLEIFMHRILWSALILFIVITAVKQWHQVKTVFSRPKLLGMSVMSAFFLSINWWLFIYAIDTEQVLEASLGYYINPLFNVLLGYLALNERTNRYQRIAIMIAFAAVLLQILALGYLPWIALLLAFSFSLYGLIKKKLAIDSVTSLTVEAIMILPFAIGYAFFYAKSHSNPLTIEFSDTLILITSGLVTTLPLLCFNIAAIKLRYATLGFFQYLAPSIMFILAVTLFDEPMSLMKFMTFVLVWSAIAIYVWDALKRIKVSHP